MALKRWHPKIIGITGSVGKSSTKEAIASVLERKYRVRKSIKSYNSELGLALAILSLETGWKNPIKWLKNILEGAVEVYNKFPPEILVLEMGVDRAGDMDRLINIARPNIGVVTAIGDIPVHVEFFAGPGELAKEKSKLIKSLPAARQGGSAGGRAILNFDDETVMEMPSSTETRADILTFGFGNGANIVASNYKISSDGISFKIEYEGASVPIRLKNVFGKQAVYASLAAVATGIACDMNLIEISEALSLYKPLPGRLRLLPGIKNSSILDDSYNASPLASHAALDTLRELEAARKIVAFGDMFEIGKYTVLAHKAIGEKVAQIAEWFITVGPRSKFASEEAVRQGMNRANVLNFSTSWEAGTFLKSIMREGDLILVKGSQAIRMERVVEEIMANPEMAPKLLVRQDKYWKNKR